MTDLPSEITEFLTGERRPMRPVDLAIAIRNEALHNAAWATATIEEWQAAIQQAVKIGKLIEDAGKVRIAPQFTEPKPKFVQKGLFDE